MTEIDGILLHDEEHSHEGNNHLNSVMIALYYWYIQIPARFLEEHKLFHVSICQDLHLFGRIRVSTEGINGVLSGKKDDLEFYEEALRKEADRFLSNPSNSKRSERYGETLDVKYCHMRKDIPEEKQKFDSLSVKIVKEVVSLNDTANNHPKRRGQKKHRYKLQDLSLSTVEGRVNQNMQNQKYLKQFQSAPHLSPQEWNERLLLSAQTKRIINDQPKTDDRRQVESKVAPSANESDAIIIDARNVYESRIGHFTVDGVPTLLTNTRKFSSIIPVLQEAIPYLAGKTVFMYCTGGVRCERASVYLQALAESEQWPGDLAKPKQVFQLEGGIQKYLEMYGNLEISNSQVEEIVKKNHTVDPTPCLYKGKNFVFDMRRYDPIVGQPGKSAGQCTLCANPHDDYDNGFAPSENNEARCCRCRMLILICNTCREKVKVWGEMSEHCVTNDSVDMRPELFCGLGGKECVDDGNKVHYKIVNG